MSRSSSLAVISALLAALVSIMAAYLHQIRELFQVCPPLANHGRSLVVLRVGERDPARSGGMTVELHEWRLWPWRPRLAAELHEWINIAAGAPLGAAAMVEPPDVFDADGALLRCAAHAGSGQAVYVAHAGAPWQWSPGRVGSRRAVRVRVAEAEAGSLDGTEGTPEAAWERVWRAAAASDGASDGVSHHVAEVSLETLSNSPPIFRARGLLTDELLSQLSRHAAPHWEPSTVGDPMLAGATEGTSRRVRDERRTSRSAWLHGHNDPRRTLPAARAVQRAVFELLRQPPARLARSVEPLLAVEYTLGQFYAPHQDFFTAGTGAQPEPAFAPPAGTNRFATAIVYLTDAHDDSAGGHTLFSHAEPPSDPTALADGVTVAGAAGAPTCRFPAPVEGSVGATGMLVRPRRGDVVVFYNQLPNGTLDGRVRHGACPVRRGATKRAVNVWVWNREVIYR